MTKQNLIKMVEAIKEEKCRGVRRLLKKSLILNLRNASTVAEKAEMADIRRYVYGRRKDI